MADVNKSVLISFTLSANFKTALNNINTAFGEISKNANNINGSLKPLASSLQKLKIPVGFKEFSAALNSLSQIKSENLNKIQQSLTSISSVRFPDFAGVNTNINAHAASVLRLAESYDRLKSALHGVNLTGLSSQINSSNNAVNNQGQSLRRNTTNFAQYAYAIGSASSGLSILGSRLYGITRGFSAISKELSASLGIFVSVFGAMFAIKGVVKDLVAFDDAMRKTGAIANASSSELKLMTDAARAMGEATRYTAQQAADGLQMLALSGLDARKAIEALPTVLNAAASEGIDLEKAASVLLGTMNAYGQEVKDLGSISDILVSTSVNSATSLVALKESMKQVAPVAASAGVSLTQLGALLGTLANSSYSGCYDKETDVLTKAGWKNWNDVTYDDEFATYNKDNNCIEYQKADRLIKYIHNGQMYKINNKNIDLCVTPDHRMFVSKGNTDNYEILFAKDIVDKFYRYKIGGMDWQGNNEEFITLPCFCQNRGSYIKNIPELKIDAKIWASFLGWYISEGHCYCDKGRNYKVVITQKKPEHLKEIEELFNALPYNWYKCELTGQYTITNEQLYRFLSPLGNCYDKHIPQYAKDWSRELLSNLLDTLIKGDGDKRNCYYTSSVRLKDDVQEIALKLGHAAYSTIHTKAGTTKGNINGRTLTNTVDAWIVFIKSQQITPPYNPFYYQDVNGLKRNNNLNYFQGYIDYNDYVYCAEVPNGLLIVRRNGKSIISGNSKAGTILKNAITRLLSPTRMVTEALGKYNLSAENLIKNNTDAATGELNFIGVLEQMREKAIKTGDSMRIFGLIAGPGMAKLLSASSDSIRQLYETLQNAEGTSLKVAYEMEAGVGGALRRLKSMWEELSLSIGDAINDDVVYFFENLTKVIKDNKETIVTFSATLMKAIDIFLSFSVGVGELILQFPKLSIAIFSAITAIGSLLTAMKIAQITGMTTAMSSLLSLNFVGMATQIGALAAKLALFNIALQSFTVASFTAGLGILGQNLLFLIGQIGVAIATVGELALGFIATNPVLITLTALLYTLGYAFNKLNPNYKIMASESAKAARATDELTRSLEYQKAELQLISKGFETAKKYGTDTASLEERLKVLLETANIPMERRIDLLNQLKNGQSSTAETLKILNSELNKETKNNLTESLTQELTAYAAQKKEIQILEQEYENLRIGRDNLSKIGLNTDKESKQLLELKNTINQSNNSLKQYGNVIQNEYIPKAIKAGLTTKQFENILQSLNQFNFKKFFTFGNTEDFLPDDEIKKYTESYNKLTEEQKKGIDVTSKYYALTEQGQKDQIDAFKILNDEYTKNTKEIEENSQNKINAIKNDEIAGIISAEKSEKSILGILNDSNKQKIALVEEYFKKAKAKYEAIVPEARTAESEITKEFEKASELRKQVIQEVFDEESARLLESRKEYTQYIEEKKKAEDKIGEAQLKAIDDHREADKKLNDELIQSAEKLKKEKIKIEESLQKELEKIDSEKTKVESESKTDSISIQEDLRDKLRKINQEKMSDSDKEFDNYRTANAKKFAGINLVNQAALKGDENLVKSGIKLIEQSSSLYEGLQNRTQATNGVISVANALMQAEQTATKIKLENLEKEKQKATETAEKEKQDKINAYNEEINAFKNAYNTKIKDAWDAANQVISAQNAEINNYKIKISLLDTEIKKTLLLKKIQATDVSNLNDRSLTNDFNQLQQYEDDLIRLTEAVKNADITPKISNEKVAEYNKVTKELASGTDLATKKMEEFGIKATSSATKAAESIAKIPEQMQLQVLVDNKELITLTGTLNEVYSNLNILKEDHTVQVKASVDQTSFDSTKNEIDSIPKQRSFSVTIPDGSIQTFTGDIDKLKAQAEELKIKYEAEGFKIKPKWDIESLTKIQEEKIDITKPTEAEINLKANTEVFDTSIDIATQAINNLDEKSPKALERAQALITGIQGALDRANKDEIEVKADSEPIKQLQEALATLQDKIVTATANVNGKSDVDALKTAIDNLKDKTITLTVNKVESGTAKADGGYIDGYANGGNVFRRLASPFINKGSGNKDDVPAMLMKGEFVQKVSAVRKYGKEFMSKLNAGIIPSAIVKHFANGGNVNNGLSSGNRYGINSNSFSNFGSDLLSMFSASMQPMIPAYALGGSVNNNNQSIASIDLNLGGKTYQVQAKQDVAKQLIKEMKKYGRTTS